VRKKIKKARKKKQKKKTEENSCCPAAECICVRKNPKHNIKPSKGRSTEKKEKRTSQKER
jgi:hypothetical protein